HHVANDTLTPAVIDALRGRVVEFNAALDQGVHVFMNTFARIPQGIDSVTAAVGRALDRLFALAQAREQEQLRQQRIQNAVSSVGSTVSSLLGRDIQGPQQSKYARRLQAQVDPTTGEFLDYNIITPKHNPEANLKRLQGIA